MELVPSGINPFDRFHGLSTVSHIEMNTSWTHEAAAQPAVAITDMSTGSGTSVSSIPSSPSDTVGSRANAPIDATGGCPEGVMGPEVLAQQQLLVKDTERVQTQLEGFSNLQRLMARPSCSIKAGDDKKARCSRFNLRGWTRVSSNRVRIRRRSMFRSMATSSSRSTSQINLPRLTLQIYVFYEAPAMVASALIVLRG
jgi:hypothetical protein